MELLVNGEKRTVPIGLTVEGLLAHLQVKKETVVVEHNLNILKRSDLAQALLQPGDAVEIIRLVGGG
jgi:thiamine biosynthesis protein ThiS